MEPLPIDARAIAIDETEPSWLGENSRYIKQILGVYLYDKNSHTYCCSLSPDYWMIHLYNQVVFTEEGERLPERDREQLREEYTDPTNNEDCYMSVYDVDHLEETLQAERWRYAILGETHVDYEDMTRDEQMESLRVQYCGNCPL
jgi:hypothetical protein